MSLYHPMCLLGTILLALQPIRASVSRQELSAVIQSIWTSDTNRLAIGRDLTLNLQTRVSLRNNVDQATRNLFTNVKSMNSKSTYKKFLALLDNYNPLIERSDRASSAEKLEQTNFIKSILGTKVWQITRSFLVNEGFWKSNDITSELTRIWFGEYSRSKGAIGSSGFEHVFVGELNSEKNEITGLHSWLQLYNLEQSGKVNYQGYVDKNTNTQVYQVQLRYGVFKKAGSSMFIGTSPEFEMAVYTLCFLVRSNQSCDFTLNESSLSIRTYTSYNKALGTAYPYRL